MVRALLLLALVGCLDGSAAEVLTDLEPGLAACQVDADCVAVARTCCGCPDFAVLSDSPLVGACDEVACPPENAACPAVAARCDGGSCLLACPDLICSLTCEGGFAVDAAGCQLCACAAFEAPECVVDTDCAQVPADCCGCAAGGEDIAVPTADVGAWTAGLGCGADAVCPDVDVCAAAAAPYCQLGMCTLATMGIVPGACGSAALVCPAGQVCVLGDDINNDSLGTCQPA